MLVSAYFHILPGNDIKVNQEAEADRSVHVEQSGTLVNMVFYCTHDMFLFLFFFGVSNKTFNTCFINIYSYYSPL